MHPDGHGVVLVAPGDRLRAYGLDLRTAPGQATVVVHGDANGFWYLIDGVEVRLSGAQLAGVLTDLGVPAAAISELVLCSCSVGVDPDGPVRDLSRALGLPVVAATTAVTVLAHALLGSRVESAGGWVRIDGDEAVQPVPAPPALIDPITVHGAQRVGPPGFRLPIEPRAPPTRAGRGASPGHLNAAQLEAVAEALLAFGADFWGTGPKQGRFYEQRRAQERQEFLSDAAAYVRHAKNKWIATALGALVERFGAAKILAELPPGYRLIHGVEVVMRDKDGTALGSYDEIDFMVVAPDGRIVEAISAKPNADTYRGKQGEEKLKLERLLAGIPTGPAQDLVEWLTEQDKAKHQKSKNRNTTYRRPHRIAKAVTAEVSWITITDENVRKDAGPVSVATFREMHGDPDPASIQRRGVTPAHPQPAEYQLDVDRDQLLDEIAAAVHRRLEEVDPAAIATARRGGAGPDNQDAVDGSDRPVGKTRSAGPGTTTGEQPTATRGPITARGPPPAGAVAPSVGPAASAAGPARPASGDGGLPTRSATEADLAQIVGEALVHPSRLGVVLAGSGDGLRGFGQRLRTARGETTVVIHGDAAGFWYLIDGVEVRLTGEQLGRVLAELGVPAGPRDLVLCSCSVGVDVDGPVRDLSLAIGRPVVAATSTVTVHLAGAGARVQSSGAWVRIDGDHPARLVPAPPALVDPAAVAGAQTVAVPTTWLPIEPGAPQVQAGPSSSAPRPERKEFSADPTGAPARTVQRALTVTAMALALVLAAPATAVAAPQASGVAAVAAAVIGPWLWVGAGVVVVIASVRFLHKRAAAKRVKAWVARTDGWLDVRPAPATGATVVLLLRWLLRALPADGTGVPVGDIGQLRTGGALLAVLSARLAGMPHRAALDALVEAGLVRIEDGPTVVQDGAFAALWARAPAELRVAMAADPATVLGEVQLNDRTAAQLAAVLLAALQEVVWSQAEVAPRAWSWVPLWLRGGRSALLEFFAQLRVVSREIDGIVGELGPLQIRLAVARKAAAKIEARERARSAATDRLLAAERTGGPQRPGAVVVAGARWAWTAARHARAVRRLPVDLRGSGPDRAIAALAGRITEVEARLVAAQERERAEAAAATAAAAAAGYSRARVTSLRSLVMLGWRARLRSPTAGAFGAFAGQGAGAHMVASGAYADHFAQSARWINTQGAIGTGITAGVGLTAASLGDRLIRSMLPIVVLGVLGSGALVVIGAIGVAALFLPAVVLVGMMGTAGGLARGRMDRYHPAAAELKDARNGQYEFAFKAVQFVAPLLIAQGVGLVGVAVTSLALAAIAAGLTAATWWVLRGVGRGAAPRAPPRIGESIKGAVAQVLATPRGLARAAASIPLFTALTGLYAAALGGSMVDQLAFINDPTMAVFATTEAAVTAVVLVRGLATLFVGPLWVPLKKLLGARGKAQGSARLDEARVLTGVAVLALVLVAPLTWLVVSPGLAAFGAVLTLGAVLTAWARMPVNSWKEGATGASLNNTAKAGSIALGSAASGAMLGGFFTMMENQVRVGAPVADLVASANLHLALLAIPVLVAPIVLARLIAKLRIGTLDELRARLVGDPVDPAEQAAAGATAAAITSKLASRGLDDEGSAAALFLDDGWRPRIFPTWRLARREWRRKSVGLTAEEHDLLLSVLATPARGPNPRRP